MAQGLLTTSAALAVMLGADVGTAVMVQVFALDLRWLAPLAIIVGVIVYLSRRNERAGQIGRIVLGLGVMILALQLITAATAPLAHAAGVKTLLAQLSGDTLLDVLIGAMFAVLSYSSLAVVLLVATLAASHVLPLHVALPLVLGANLGSGLLALLTTMKSDAVTRRVPLGNFVFKAVGLVLALALLPFAMPWLLGAACRAGNAGGRLSSRLQRAARADLHPVHRTAWHGSPSAGCRTYAARKAPDSRAISTRSRWPHRRWRSAMPRAKRSGWPTPCRTCSTAC